MGKINVAELIKDRPLIANFFEYDAYVRGDLELGLLENRRGDRLIAIPDTLINALYEGLSKETGQAARLVMINCGKWWGKSFYNRFQQSLQDFYGITLQEMDMLTFVECLKEYWRTHGWGILEFDPEYRDRGLIVIRTYHSAFSRSLPGEQRPSCFLETGILTSFFSKLVGRDLLAVQTTCESLGADCNRFIIGIPERLAKVDDMVLQGMSHDGIVQSLCL
ncbi:MAG: V4R domain-containing protein [Pseudanabaenaceae cyanobacterium]